MINKIKLMQLFYISNLEALDRREGNIKEF